MTTSIEAEATARDEPGQRRLDLDEYDSSAASKNAARLRGATFRNLLIHVGFPKTGTTWLQSSVFGNAELGFVSPWGERAGLGVDLFVRANAYRFDPDTVRATLQPGAEAAVQSSLIPVLSEETLIGDPTSGRYWGKQCADRIARALPEARILITLREQESLVLSSYREYVLSGGQWELDRFLGASCPRPGFGGVIELAELEYDLVVEHYQNLFGKDRVLVLFLEDLRDVPRDVVVRLLRFVNRGARQIGPSSTAKQVGLRGASIALNRFLNGYVPLPNPAESRIPLSRKLLYRACRFTDRFVPESIHNGVDDRMRQAVRRFVADRFNASNRRLQDILTDQRIPDAFRKQ